MSTITAVANPTVFFAEELRATLFRHGIEVDGAAADIDDLSDRPRAAEGQVLLVDQSPPLAEIVDVTLKWSRNAHAEALLMALDASPPAAARDALPVMRETLASLGIAPEGYTTRDGSGSVAQRLPVGRHAGRDAGGGVAAAAPARPARGGAATRRPQRLAGRPSEGHRGRGPGAGQDRLHVQRALAGRLRRDRRRRAAGVRVPGQRLRRAGRGHRRARGRDAAGDGRSGR